MDVKQLYNYVLDQSLAVAEQVRDTDMDKPTPDTDWTVRDLMQHIMTELVWLPDMLTGKTVQEVGDAHDGDLLGPDPAASWRAAAAAARAAVEAADLQATAHLSYADKPVGTYLLESADDVLVHTWDLGRAIDVDVTFDEAAAQTLYDHMASRADELAGSGLFGQRINVPEEASAQTKLLALLGRSQDWR